MNDVEMLKKITGETDEELLMMLLETAEEKVLSLANRTKMIYPLKPAVRDWAVAAYNRLGTEGELNRSGGGISSSFAEIPKDIEQTIKRYRLGRVHGHAYINQELYEELEQHRALSEEEKETREELKKRAEELGA